MKEHKKLLGLAAGMLLAISPSAWAINALSSTGVGAIGTVDANYTLVDGSGQVSLIQAISGGAGQLIGGTGPWVANPGDGAQWISPWIPDTSKDPWVSDNASYTYIFQTTALSTGTVLGQWSSDNGSTIWVNGVATANTIGGAAFGALSPFSLNLTVGDIVQFRVNNGATGTQGSNPAGLLVDITGMATPDGGSTLMLLGVALSAMGLLRRKLIA